MNPHAPERSALADQLLLQHLQTFLGPLDAQALALLRRELEWTDLASGQVLMRQGEPGDALYLLVSGRLRVSIGAHTTTPSGDGEGGEGGNDRKVREITGGQVVGEMSLFTDEARSATVVAVRDSLLVRLGKPQFLRLVASSSAASMALTRQVIQRLQTHGHEGREGRRSQQDRPLALALLPLGGEAGFGISAEAGFGTRAEAGFGISAEAAHHFAEQLAAQLRLHGTVAVLDAARLEAHMGAPGITALAARDADAARRIALCLDEMEARHRFVLLLADPGPTPWTQRCSRHCDELLLLADAQAPPQLHTTERQCLGAPAAGGGAAQVLLLLHPAQCASPRHTVDWLQPRTLAAHVHLRQGHAGDLARLARLLSRTAVGLVLSGGGARGAAHAGVYRALMERGVPVDCIGGTSMGAVFGALMALHASADEVVNTFAQHFGQNPTGDYNLLPLMSLIKGRRLRGMMQRTERSFGGSVGLGIEDLWKTFFCVATNYTQAREEVLRKGPLVNGVMASCAIPGALPPVLHQGDLLCDGGTFNNFPVDPMRQAWGVGQVIGVDLGMDPARRINLDQLPGPWAQLLDRLRRKSQRRYRLPSLSNYLMNATTLYSTARQRASSPLTDLYIKPALPKVGMLQWDRFAQAVQLGHDHTLRVLDARADQAAVTPRLTHSD